MNIASANKKLLPLIVVCQLMLLGAVVPAWAEDALPETKTKGDEKRIEEGSVEEPKGIVGIAHYYAKRFHGRKTSSGQRHDSQKLTAAHATLPLGTRVKVVNLANDRSVVVTINDRCRRHRFPFIDVSRQAAKDLGFFHHAKARVRMIVLSKEGLSADESMTPGNERHAADSVSQ